MASGGGAAAGGAILIPAGVNNLSEDGTLTFEGRYNAQGRPGANDFDAAELERLVSEYGSAIKAVELG